jgi:hypothetical protein
VNLRDIGLAADFENSMSVKNVIQNFMGQVLSRVFPGYQTSVEAISDVTNEPNLFSVGHSTVFMDAACGGSGCSFDFQIRDWFEDPLGFGFEVGGTPYRINHEWTVRKPFW